MPITHSPQISPPLKMSAQILLGSQDAASELGIDLIPSLEIAGIEPDQLTTADQFIPVESVNRFFNDVAARSGCDHFGFLVAIKQPPNRFARVGQLVKFAGTLGVAIEDALRFSLLNSEYSAWYLEQDDQYAALVRKTNVRLPESTRQLTTLAVTLVYKALHALSAGKLNFVQIHLTSGTPMNRARMESYFEVPVLFNQVHNAIVFDRRDLQLTIPTADAQVYELIKQQLTSIADVSGGQKSFEAHVVHEIKRSLGSRYDTLAFVSKQLGLHPRRLQRDLKARGTSFQILLKRVKIETAMDYLQQSDISVSELSDFLGYQNVSAFSRAFRRDVGISPIAWKQANKAV